MLLCTILSFSFYIFSFWQINDAIYTAGTLLKMKHTIVDMDTELTKDALSKVHSVRHLRGQYERHTAYYIGEIYSTASMRYKGMAFLFKRTEKLITYFNTSKITENLIEIDYLSKEIDNLILMAEMWTKPLANDENTQRDNALYQIIHRTVFNQENQPNAETWNVKISTTRKNSWHMHPSPVNEQNATNRDIDKHKGTIPQWAADCDRRRHCGLAPAADRSAACGRGSSLRRNSAPAHRAKSTQDWLAAREIYFIRHEDWPSSSPDLSPLDYKIWQHLKEKACSKPHPNLESLKTSLNKATADIDMDLVRAAIDEWPRKLKACIQNHGGHFE
ncbi:unnamed protein product [Chilo suppressalis]|uniref:Uncharacterized protein n=1 Tax=Chilo suppressalis TaxID=168631 RepID=A0ABN8B7G8_CHISP|nr:hypothetical protein evm_012595 [Chilo suppressalis]CAH0401915.1 unnamed protein product [Chilo suppressalis]